MKAEGTRRDGSRLVYEPASVVPRDEVETRATTAMLCVFGEGELYAVVYSSRIL